MHNKMYNDNLLVLLKQKRLLHKESSSEKPTIIIFKL